MKEIKLEKALVEQVGQIGSADILVGIPSYNNAKTIGHVVRAVQAGRVKYFPHHKSVLLNSDGVRMIKPCGWSRIQTWKAPKPI